MTPQKPPPRVPPSRVLRDHPDLDQLRRQAKEFLAAFRAGETGAVAEVRDRHPDADPQEFALHDAQLVLARSYGFESWPKLKAYVDRITVAHLADAIRSRDIAKVRQMLEQRPELVHLDAGESDEHRALHYAVLARSVELVRLFMQYGADPKKGIYPHRDATSAFTLATDRGYDEIVAAIKEEEARRPREKPLKGVPEPGGESELMKAVKKNKLDVVARLLAEGVDPNERMTLPGVDEAFFTAGGPLHFCATHERLEMAKLLLEAGADPNAHVYAGGSAMNRAYTARNAEMIELLAGYGGVPDAISVAIVGDVQGARRILEDEAAGTLHPAVGTAVAADMLWGAAGVGGTEIVKLCLARIDWPSDDERWYSNLREPLYIGFSKSKEERAANIECFRLILERTHADVGARRREGWLGGRTLLHDLSPERHEMPAQDRVTIATMLLDAGASLDIRDDLLKSTPLGWACRWGRVELVELLLERGADPFEADAEPWATPRAWATKRGHKRILALLDR